jgi:hypothetical protein
MALITPIYGSPRKLPQHALDRDPPTKVIDVDAPYIEVSRTPQRVQLLAACYSYELANELERQGFKVLRPVTNPNGSGGTRLSVILPLPRALPKQVTIP